MTNLFLITGTSGAGKSTIIYRLLQDKTLNLVRFVTTTTRAPRPNEENGVDYWFVDKETFLKKVAANDFFEWAHIYGHMSGTDRQEIERLKILNRPIILSIDVQGLKPFKTAFPEAPVIFIDAPVSQLIRRLEDRKTSKEDIEIRTKKIEEEEKFKPTADAVIINEDGKLEETVERVKAEIRGRMKE